MNSDNAQPNVDQVHDEESARIARVYEYRQFDADPEYCKENPVYRQRVEQIERLTVETLHRLNLYRRLGTLELLDVGCGNGSWFAQWKAWGASGSYMTGVDYRESAIALARRAFPESRFLTVKENRLPFQDGEFDIIVQNTAFSSILSQSVRKTTAKEITRLLKPGGIFLSWDMVVNNPKNPNVLAVRRSDLTMLFDTLSFVDSRKVTLAPPVARLLIPYSRKAAAFVEFCFPILRSHLFAVMQKPVLREPEIHH